MPFLRGGGGGGYGLAQWLASRTTDQEASVSIPGRVAVASHIYTLLYGVRKGSKAAVPVHRYFFTGASVKYTGGPLNYTGAPLYFTGTPLYLPVDC